MRNYKYILLFILLSIGVGHATEPIIIPTRNNLVVHATSPRILVLLGNFSDSQLGCEIPVIEGKWDQVISLYEEISFGSIEMPTDYYGPYTIAMTAPSGSGCDFNTIYTQMDEQALQHGIDESQYGHIVYVMPYGLGCGLGVSTVGGNPSLSWLFKGCQINADVYAHEWGHAIGMHHASLVNPNGSISSYGDTSDIMGYSMSRLYQTNAPHRDQMAWSGSIRTVTQSGTYTVAPLENDGDMLLIGPLTNGKHLFVSYRQAIGYDANLETQYYTVAIHEYERYRAVQTYLLALLDNGQSYTDTVNGITITGGVKDSESAFVSISLSQGSVPAPPSNLRVVP